MQLVPAIDLLGGKVVRLYQGRYEESTIYDQDPVELAIRFYEHGVRVLHVVDLDGAKEGRGENTEVLAAICKKVPLSVEVGGGIRSKEDAQSRLDVGAARVMIGTLAVTKPDVVLKMAMDLGVEHLMISLDTKAGKVQTDGWLSESTEDPYTMAKRYHAEGLRHFVYTDVLRDGTLVGPDLVGLNRFSDLQDISIWAAGGIGSMQDVCNLTRLAYVSGAITGRAFYEGKITLGAMKRFMQEGASMCS